jgi:hypothetical protein
MGKCWSVLGSMLARYLNKVSHQHGYMSVHTSDQFLAALQPGDVLLVEGNRRINLE